MGRLEKRYQLNTDAKNFFLALTDQILVSQWSGAPAIMSAEPGGKFSLWGGSIVGVNSEVSKSRLSQQWKEKSWKNYSHVVFEWEEGKEKLTVTLTHENIPKESFEDITRGWDEHYMIPLITWIESNNL